MEEVGAALPPPATRIYVGGLSASVTAAEVEKTFSSVGRVRDVELVRTKGRSFAFMDFQPSSDKSLAKLFATYNGCKWKGGKLKLERAKEHYLVRLKREWAEDAELLSTPALDLCVEKRPCSSKKAETQTTENMQLRIFFPKLRKVKALPFKGTGKHKYSFQRMEVPSFPIHFCDCEEHCWSSETAGEKNPSSLTSVVHEKERSIMNSVMKKLFEKDENEKLYNEPIAVDVDSNNMDSSVKEAKLEEEYQSADADNLVTNIGKGRSNDMLDLMLLKQGGELSVDQVKKSDKLHSSKDGKNPEKVNTARRRDGSKRTSEDKLREKDQPASADKVSVDGVITPSLHSKESSTGVSQGMEILMEPMIADDQNEPSVSNIHSIRGQSWVQKSSWKELVGGLGENVFSISQVLPGISKTPSKLPVSNSSTSIKPAALKKRKIWSGREGSISSQVVQSRPIEKPVPPAHAEVSVNGDMPQANPYRVQKEEPQMKSDQMPRRTIPKIIIGEVCPFMRSTDSEKEWAKAKAALSGSLKKKKKISEADASKGSKGMPHFKR